MKVSKSNQYNRRRENSPKTEKGKGPYSGSPARNGADADPEGIIEGRNAVLEAFRSGRTFDKLYVQKDCKDGAVMTILREAKKSDVIVNMVAKERLDQMSETKVHQGVIARAAAYSYASVEEILNAAKESGEDPFLVLLDGVEDPHNLGAVIRTAGQAGAHGVIISKHRCAGITPAAVKASAGAVSYVPVAKVSNIGKTLEELKQQGIWSVCADMGGTCMYDLDLKGPIAVVVGSEGNGVSRLVKEKCDFTASIPMKGKIDSLNVSVAFGVIAYEIYRQRSFI